MIPLLNDVRNRTTKTTFFRQNRREPDKNSRFAYDNKLFSGCGLILIVMIFSLRNYKEQSANWFCILPHSENMKRTKLYWSTLLIYRNKGFCYLQIYFWLIAIELFIRIKKNSPCSTLSISSCRDSWTSLSIIYLNKNTIHQNYQ